MRHHVVKNVRAVVNILVELFWFERNKDIQSLAEIAREDWVKFFLSIEKFNKLIKEFIFVFSALRI